MPFLRLTSRPQPIPRDALGHPVSHSQLCDACFAWFRDIERIKAEHPFIVSFSSAPSDDSGAASFQIEDRIPVAFGLHSSIKYSATFKPVAPGASTLETESKVDHFRFLRSRYSVEVTADDGQFVVVDESEFELQWHMWVATSWVTAKLTDSHQHMIDVCAADINDAVTKP